MDGPQVASTASWLVKGEQRYEGGFEMKKIESYAE